MGAKTIAVLLAAFTAAAGASAVTFRLAESGTAHASAMEARSAAPRAVPYATVTDPAQFIATVVRDKRNGDQLAVRLGSIDTGRYVFIVADTGTYSGVAPVKTDGTEFSVYGDDLAATFQPASGGPTLQVMVRLDASIETRLPSPQAHATIKQIAPSLSHEYQIHTDDTDAKHARKVFDQVADAIKVKDFGALYDLETSQVTSTISRADFVARLQAQTPGTVTDVTATGEAVETSAQGFRYDTQPVNVTLQKADGSTLTQPSHITLVLEAGRWRLQGTDKGLLGP